jgi:hypothetical protein
LNEALQRGARYSSIANEGMSLSYFEGGENISMSFAYVNVSRHTDRHQIEFWMVALVRICRQVVGLRLIPARVRLTHQRDRATSEFARFFGGLLEFGAAIDEVAFAPSIKQIPIVSADPSCHFRRRKERTGQSALPNCAQWPLGRPTLFFLGLFRSPLRTGTAHVVLFGPIRIT